MTKDLAVESQYDRIPAIWQVAIACGRQNDATQIKNVLTVSLPQADQPLRDWQAVVIGGGIINGISQRNVSPGQRIAALIADDPSLVARWQQALDLASKMADDTKVKNGTRYDALRILGVEPSAKHVEQLKKYLMKETNQELQTGAVAALIDMGSTEAASALLDALAAKDVKAGALDAPASEKLRNHFDEAIRRRATELLPAEKPAK